MAQESKKQPSKTSRDKDSSEFSFGRSMAELEKIAQDLERGEIGLDEAIKQFERGTKLANELKEHLSKAENTINQLKQNFEQPTTKAEES